MNKGTSKLIDKWSREGLDKIIVMCSCMGGDDHYLIITRDQEYPGEFYVTVQESDSGSIWERLKYAWRWFWYGPFNEQLVFEEEEIRELGKVLVELPHIEPKKENNAESTAAAK